MNPVEKRFEETLHRILERPLLHARFANTLSFLEYLGARKILKSQGAASVSTKLLSHAAEEIRHARILKRFALRLSGGRVETYADGHLLCGEQAHAYFHGVDELGTAVLGRRKSRENYLLTTILIEERVMKIYPTYERILNDWKISNPIRVIMRDESEHLLAVVRELTGSLMPSLDSLTPLREKEQSLFGIFMAEVRAVCDRELPSHASRNLPS